MKFLMINVVCGIGSTGRICTDLARVLENEGHTVKIAYGREHVPEDYKKYAVRIGSDLSVRMDGLKTRLFDDAGFNSQKATEKFIEWVKEYDPDVIHLHNIHGYYINVEILFQYLRTCGKKIIWTLHDCWAFTGHCSHYTFNKCIKWKTGCLNCKYINEYPKSLFYDNSKKNYNKKLSLFTNIPNLTIVTPSDWLKKQVEMSFLKNYKIVKINNGIDKQIFKKKNICDINKKFIDLNLGDYINILGVSNVWNDEKGLSDFILLANNLDCQYKILLVGNIKRNIKYKLPNNIINFDKTDNIQELVDIYNLSDIFLNLSHQETMGMVCIEAQSCGTPVIVYDDTSLPETVNKKCGFTCEEGNINQLISLICTIDKAKITNDCIIFSNNFSKEINAREYLKIYMK